MGRGDSAVPEGGAEGVRQCVLLLAVLVEFLGRGARSFSLHVECW